MKDKRKFLYSICVKNGTKRHRIECSPAEIYGGQEGFFRIRHNRKWVDIEEKQAFFNFEKIGKFISGLLDNSQYITQKPEIKKGTRCSIVVWEDGIPTQLGAMTGSEPILDFNGVWQVYVIAYGFQGFYPCKDLILKGRAHAKQKSDIC